MAANSDWYRTLFSGLMIEAYRRIPWPTAQDVECILKLLEPKSGAKILDVPCGNGRLAAPIAQKGYDVTGVDQCTEYLADARQAGSVATRFEQRDMRDLPWNGEFDCAYCWGNSFSYFGEPGDQEFL